MMCERVGWDREGRGSVQCGRLNDCKFWLLGTEGECVGGGEGRGGVCGRFNDVFKFWLMWKQRVSECVVGRGCGRGSVQCGRSV